MHTQPRIGTRRPSKESTARDPHEWPPRLGRAVWAAAAMQGLGLVVIWLLIYLALSFL